MRVLFASLGSVGHTYPLIPLAIAARTAGHDVHFATGEHVHGPLTAHGLRPFRPADAFYEFYAEDLEPELRRLRPDLVVHGWGLPGAAIAARRLGIPSLWHGFGRMFPDGIGLERPMRVPEAAGRAHLDICPPSLQDKGFVAGEHRIELRPVPFSEPGAMPSWDGRRPVIYVTLGTAFGTPELLTTIVGGLSGRVVVAAGRVHPKEVAGHDGVTVHPWVPQSELLPYADLVVHHGGSGTTLGALAAGLPQLILPQGADQFANADVVAAAGAALCLRPGEVSAEAVAEHARKLLSDSGFRDAARAIAAEIARMPSPDEVARMLPAYADGWPT